MLTRSWFKPGRICLVAWLATSAFSHALASDLSDWLAVEEGVASRYLLDNISPPGAMPGAIVASPSRHQPDYYYHWVRDAACVGRVLVYHYEISSNAADRQHYLDLLVDYALFSRRIQQVDGSDFGIGEPKFYVDGAPYLGPWGRPQNDGPAARAIVFTEWANILLDEGRYDLVRMLLYQPGRPGQSLIGADLNYLADHGRDSVFDLWEEVKGQHFYTRMMVHRALLDGARLAARIGDLVGAQRYGAQGAQVGRLLRQHLDPVTQMIIPTLGRDGGIDYKVRGLDSAVVLGVLLGHVNEDGFGLADAPVLKTVAALERAFRRDYGVNADGQRGLAIGRYPEDRYDGISTTRMGNPWVPTTAAFAQFYYRLATQFERAGAFTVTETTADFFDLLPTNDFDIRSPGTYTVRDARFSQVLQALRAKGDQFLEAIRLSAGPDGALSEQIQRDTGEARGAPHLSASYGTLLWAIWARRGAFPIVDYRVGSFALAHATEAGF